MSECVSAEMRDALPDFVHGQLGVERTAAISAHLVECAECAAEVELLRAVVASAPATPTMDVERIASALPTPTRHGFLLHRGGAHASHPVASPTQPAMPRSSSVWSRSAVKIAAAVAIVTAGGLSLLVGRDVLRPEAQVGQAARTREAASPSATVSSAASSAASGTVAVAAVTTPARQQTLQVTAASGAGLSLVGELQELSDEHLTTLLKEMDRMDGLPAAEPDALEPAVGSEDFSGGAQ